MPSCGSCTTKWRLGRDRERLLHFVGAVPDDDGRGRRTEAVGSRQDAIDQRSAGDLVEHLRPLGFHPRAFAGGEDDDVKIGHREG